MILAISPALVGFVAVVLILGVGLSILNVKGMKKERSANQEIADKSGLRFIHLTPKPVRNDFFKVFQHADSTTKNIAIDPKTADMSMHLHYFEPSLIRVKGGGPRQGTNYDYSVAVVTTGFWLTDPFAVYRRGRISRKGKFESHNEQFDQMYRVKSQDLDATATVLTPAFINALVHPPFEFKKKDDFELLVRGPQMMVQCQLVTFEQRIALMRWMQQLITLVDTNRVPGYGQVSVNIVPGEGYTPPQISYRPVGTAALRVDDSYDLDNDEASVD